MKKNVWSVYLCCVGVLCALVPISAYAAGLPSQDIVLVIDNSGSMKETDPLRLRGVAASLVLDAAALVSSLKAGIVFFSTSADADTKFDEPERIKFRLQSDKLPAEEGGTNMQAALEAALNLLQASTAQQKKIILLTDGGPDPGQDATIRSTLVPRIKASGIKLYALGLSKNVNQAFLDEISVGTGGIAVIAESHKDLLKNSKKVLGKNENVFTIDDKHLQDNEIEHKFEIPEGIDRARLTVILDNASLFAPGQIDFDLKGPGKIDSQSAPYSIKKDNADRVVAWSAFLSSPPKGEYTLAIKVDKPPFTGHQGVTVLLEVRSDVNIEILLNPEQEEYYFGDQVDIDVFPYKASGPIDPTLVTVSGKIETEKGGGGSIVFSGISGSFTVPESPGRHTIYIEAAVSPKLPPTIVTKSYRAIPPEPANLKSSRAKIVFQNELGPEHLTVEESFRIDADFPEGKYRKIKVTAFLDAPHISDLAMLKTQDGNVIKMDGKKEVSIPPKSGLELMLGFQYGAELSFDKPLNLKEPKYSGTLLIRSKDAADDLEIPFEVRVRIPSLELLGQTDALSLWWSPEATYPRTFTLGAVTTDANEPSEFRVVVPSEDILITDGPKDAKQRKIATWHLLETEETKQHGDKSGEFFYGPYPLARSKYRLQAMITPDAGEYGTKFVKGTQTFGYEVQSKFGVRKSYQVKFLTLPPPWWSPPYLSDLIAPVSLYGQHLLIWLSAILLFFFVRPVPRINLLRKYGGWRKEHIKRFAPGAINLGGGGKLEFPNLTHAPRTKVCAMTINNNEVMIEGTKYVQLNKAVGDQPKVLKKNDMLSILDPRNPRKPLWKLRYMKFDSRTQELIVKIQDSPIRDNFIRIVSGLVVAMIVFALIKHGLTLPWTAGMAYKIPLIDFLYSTIF
jgi:uncharacterized protein YegL